MRMFLAVMLMSGALLVSASAALAQDATGIDDQIGPFVVDPQASPFVSWWAWWWWNPLAP
jgi:hypothetical protein